MSTNVGSIHYDLKLDTSGFDGASENINKKLGGMSKTLGDLGGKMVSTGKTMTLGLTLPIVAGAALAVKGASDMVETMNKVNVAFGESAKRVTDFGNTSLKSIGLAKGSALDAAALFGDMATSMGLSQSAAADMSVGLVTLGGDLASFKNISFEQAQTALAGVFTGETESLKRLGIVMTDTELNAYALSKGIGKTTQEMTQGEKVNLRYAFVMDKTKNAQGDFARTSDGTANQMRFTAERVKELTAEFGEKLLPIMGKLLEFGNKLLDFFSGFDAGTQNMIIGILGAAAAAGPLLIFFGKIGQAVETLAPIFETIGAAIASIGAGPILIAIAAVAAAGYLIYRNWNTLVGVFNKVVEALKSFYAQAQPIRDFIAGQLNTAIDSLKRTWDQLVIAMQPLIDMFKLFWSEHGTKVMEVLKVIAMVVAAIAIAPLALAFGLLVGVLTIVSAVLKFVADNFEIIKNVVMVVGALIFGPLILAFMAVINVFNMLRNAIVAVFSFIQPILNLILNLFIIVFGGIFLAVHYAISSVFNVIVSVWNAIWAFIAPTVQRIAGFLTGTFSSIYGSLAGIFNGILGVARNVWNAISGAITGAMNNVRGFFAGAGGWLYGAGRDLIQGLINGVANMAGAIFGKAQEIANGVKNRIKDALRIGSPSKVMIGFGTNVGEGLTIGMQKSMPDINAMAGRLAGGIQAPMGQLGTTSNNQTTEQTSVNNNIYGNISLGDKSAVDTFFDRMNRNGELASKGMTTI